MIPDTATALDIVYYLAWFVLITTLIYGVFFAP